MLAAGNNKYHKRGGCNKHVYNWDDIMRQEGVVRKRNWYIEHKPLDGTRNQKTFCSCVKLNMFDLSVSLVVWYQFRVLLNLSDPCPVVSEVKVFRY